MTDLEQILCGVFATAAVGAFWWIVNKLSSNNAAVHKRIDDLIKECNEKYVRRDDFKEFREELRHQLREISIKIDRAYWKEQTRHTEDS